MTVEGFPIHVFAPVALGAVFTIVAVWQMTVLAKTLGVNPNDPVEGKRFTAALYGGETKLHDLGVHKVVWTIRLAFIANAACILLFIFLILRAIEAV